MSQHIRVDVIYRVIVKTRKVFGEVLYGCEACSRLRVLENRVLRIFGLKREGKLKRRMEKIT
jgi:hypothetical protein